MCLSTVTKKIGNSKLSKGVGYKIFDRSCNSLPPSGEYYTPDRYCAYGYPIGKWINADGNNIMADDGHFYPSGFHIFTSLKSAVKYLAGETYLEIRKVQYRDAHTLGTQSNGRCIVAKEIKLGKVIRAAYIDD